MFVWLAMSFYSETASIFIDLRIFIRMEKKFIDAYTPIKEKKCINEKSVSHQAFSINILRGHPFLTYSSTFMHILINK